jgi:hypothetical protein
MKRRIAKTLSGLSRFAGPGTPRDLGDEGQQGQEDGAVGRRSLLTRGGAVVAGVVGASAAGAAVAASANAAPGDPVLQGSVNSVGTNVAATQITATNAVTTPTPTVVLSNLGGDTTAQTASPSLRLTPAATGLFFPADATVGGDMVATNDGELWFTHAIPGVATFPAIVHTDFNSDSFVPLRAPLRILDTRTSAGRVHVLDPVGKFDSTGRLLGGKTIHIDLTSLVFFGVAVTSNLTVTQTVSAGFLTLWSGVGARPNASSINFAAGATLSNLTVSGIAEFTVGTVTITDTIAIFAAVTTQVILDVAGFNVENIGQVNPAFTAPRLSPSARAQRARQALANRTNPNW